MIDKLSNKDAMNMLRVLDEYVHQWGTITRGMFDMIIEAIAEAKEDDEDDHSGQHVYR